MAPSRFENLARTGELIAEPPHGPDLDRLLASAKSRLHDAHKRDISFDSRFDLAYNAAHALALVALRRHGFRPKNRYIVFQLLEETAGIPSDRWRVLATAHARRNVAEYEGALDVDEPLLSDLLAVADEVLARLEATR